MADHGPKVRLAMRLLLVSILLWGLIGLLVLAATGNAAAANIPGTNQADTLIGTGADDSISGLGGRDVLKGLGGQDMLEGGFDDDSLYGGPGKDKLHGGYGHDFLDGGNERHDRPDVLYGGPGDDLFYVYAGDYAKCGDGFDTVYAVEPGASWEEPACEGFVG